MFIHPESGYLDVMRRALRGVRFLFIRAHGEFATGNPHHARRLLTLGYQSRLAFGARVYG
jgi:hypothetical protein